MWELSRWPVSGKPTYQALARVLSEVNFRFADNPYSSRPNHLKMWPLIEDLQHLSVVGLQERDRFAVHADSLGSSGHAALW
jgi:hypothetical protein